MKKVSLLFFFWVIILYAFTASSSTSNYFDYSYESTAMIKEYLPKVGHLLNFDGGHYHNISHFGYIKKFQTAFFPLYPVLINLFGYLFQSHLISALLISLACTYLSLLVLVRLYKKSNSTLLLISFPLSFFFLTGYTESLFLLLSLLSWHHFQKKKYLFSGALGFLASLSRFYGILLFPSFLLEYFLKLPKDKRFKPTSYGSLLPLLMIPFGLGIYMSYLQLTYRDPFSFLHALSLWNKSAIVFPLQTIYRYLKMLTTVSPNILQFWVALLELLSLSFGILMSYLLYKQKQYAYSLYVFLGSIIPAFTGTLQSLPRYLIVLFPIYFIELPTKIRPFVLTLGFILQLVLLTAFLSGKFVS